MTKDLGDIDPVDLHVGRRFRLARVTSGLSQMEVGRELNLSFQQIQKYENGINRVSASKLFHMSVLTGYPVEWFFEGLDRRGMPTRDIDRDLISPREWQFLTAFRALPPEMRTAVLELFCVLPEES